MIPKTIHYCWFGRGPKSKKEIKCIESWKKFCPNYKIIEWNEDNFDLNLYKYARQAYEVNKYAFVTDVVRLYVLYNYGGIYMDTDVELVSSIDAFLENHAFSGFESCNAIPTGIMACEKGFDLFKELLDFYDGKSFFNIDGSMNEATNCQYITNICLNYGLVLNNRFQMIRGFVLYPSDFFCPFNNETGKLQKSKNTVAIHWFSKSWVDNKTKKKIKFTRILHRFLGTQRVHKWAVRLGLRQ